MKKKIMFIILFSILVLMASFSIMYLNSSYEVNKDLGNVDLTNVNKLMIVAHPDDESIWGGAHLLEDDYLVVCITCGTNRLRVLEFDKAMSITHDKYVMLGYPDKTGGKRNDWSKVEDDLFWELEKIIDYKDWELIVTHNPEGEYGHFHHIKTNEIVTFLADNEKLMYFGKYFSKRSYQKVDGVIPKISDKLYKKKTEKLLKVYKTQGFIMNTFDQMFPHEDFIKATDWR